MSCDSFSLDIEVDIAMSDEKELKVCPNLAIKTARRIKVFILFN